MKSKIILVFVFLFLLVTTFMSAHPGSGIVIDQYGQIYFTDTGKGIWKIDVRGNLTFIPASRFHWMLLDEPGSFAESPKNFGGYFERINPAGSKTTLIMCSDF
ncbi:MAG: hypothetical protein ABIR66_13925, partial [Saprospiraceae bacterium]